MEKLRIVLCDDEPLILTLLKQIIDWDGLGLTLCAQAGNGQSLLTCINEYHPDIVITDICMPEMSGIDLIQTVRESGNTSHFIIVSGYRQFEYAYNALKYNVDGYLLKPIDENELNECLRRSAESIRKATKQQTIPESKPASGYHRLFLSHIISDGASFSNKTLNEINREFDASFTEGSFLFSVVRLDLLQSTADSNINALALTENIARCFQKALKPYASMMLFDCRLDSIAFLVNTDPAKEACIPDALKDGYQRARQYVDLFIGLKMTLAVGSSYRSLSECGRSYEEANAAMACRIRFPNQSNILWSSLCLDYSDLKANAFGPEQKQLISCAQALDSNGFRKAYLDLMNRMSSIKNTVQILGMLAEICRPLAKLFAELQGKSGSEDYLYSEFSYRLSGAHSAEALINSFFRPMEEMILEQHSVSEKKAKRPIRQAVSYMEKHYAEPLRMETVAELVFLSPHYFSTLFVSEIGVTFSDYLINLRIESAKQYLRETNQSIAAIAAAVGYSDSRYFSRLFTQKVGIKPKDYRRIYG